MLWAPCSTPPCRTRCSGSQVSITSSVVSSPSTHSVRSYAATARHRESPVGVALARHWASAPAPGSSPPHTRVFPITVLCTQPRHALPPRHLHWALWQVTPLQRGPNQPAARHPPPCCSSRSRSWTPAKRLARLVLPTPGSPRSTTRYRGSQEPEEPEDSEDQLARDAAARPPGSDADWPSCG